MEISDKCTKILKDHSPKSPVSLLYEHCQVEKLEIKFIAQCNYHPFTCYFEIDGIDYPTASGHSKKLSKQNAAILTINKLVNKRQFSFDHLEPIKIPIQASDGVYDKISRLANEFADSHHFEEWSGMATPTVFACIIEYDSADDSGQVVSWATGNNCITSFSLKKRQDGTALFDCHAEILARRGWMRYIYHVMHKAAGNSPPPQEKFEKFTVNDGFSYHLFISRTPCGDGQVFVKKEPLKRDELPRNWHRATKSNWKRGRLRVKLEEGAGSPFCDIPTGAATWDTRLRTMSCSDKILKWNVLGLQGSLLSQLVKPIFLQSITVGELYHHAHLARAVCCRAQKLDLRFSTVNHPVLVKDSRHQMKKKKGSDNFAYTWNIVDRVFEKLDPDTGTLASGGISKISKRQFYEDFARLKKVAKGKTYSEAKSRAVKYKAAQEEFEQECDYVRYGVWKQKEQVDEFTL